MTVRRIGHGLSPDAPVIARWVAAAEDMSSIDTPPGTPPWASALRFHAWGALTDERPHGGRAVSHEVTALGITLGAVCFVRHSDDWQITNG